MFNNFYPLLITQERKPTSSSFLMRYFPFLILISKSLKYGMHEWALAQAVIKSTIALSDEKGIKSVGKIILLIGELQNIDMEIFDFALKELSKGTVLENTPITYKKEEAVLTCNRCGYTWPYDESFTKLSEEEKEAIHFIPETLHIYIHCPECGSVDFDVKKGRGIFIEDVD